MTKLLCDICNKEYKNLNQHYDTNLHKNKLEEIRENLLRRCNPKKYDRKKKLKELLKNMTVKKT